MFKAEMRAAAVAQHQPGNGYHVTCPRDLGQKPYFCNGVTEEVQ